MKRIAIIPARGGSKRIPRKNVIDFHGHPMISYVIKAALESEIFDEVHVSTEDSEIAEISKKYGASIPFMRDPAVADDFTPVLAVARWVLKQYQSIGKSYDSFTLIMPCSPLINSSDYIEANKIYEKHKGEIPVLSVARYPSPVEWAFQETNGVLRVADPEKLSTRSQDLKEYYYDTGNFSIQNAQVVINSESIVSAEFIRYEIERIKAIDIDTQDDLELLKKIYTLYQ